MTLIEHILLGLALAMDCFSVSIASGLILKQYRMKPILLMAILFGVFQGLMPMFGWLLSISFGQYVEHIGHWIAFALLLFIGCKMIYDYLHDSDTPSFNPNKPTAIITLAIATSIDALAVGVSFMCMGMTTFTSIISPVVIISIISTIMSLSGSIIGISLGKRFKFPAELIGGLILIGIGIKILI